MGNITMTLTEIRGSNPGEDFGLGDYPIFDENYRIVLNEKIYDRYCNREIGSETVEEFRKWMRRRMREIMPYYNQLYLSERLAIDPLNTVNMATLVDGEMNATSEGQADSTTASQGKSDQSTSASSRARTVDMQTPQNKLSGTSDYATGAQDSGSKTSGQSGAINSESGNSSSKNKAVSDSKTNTKSSTKGYSGSQAVLLTEYRRTFLNIDVDIIDSLSDLFMSVLTSGNSYTQKARNYIANPRFW